MKVPTSSLKKSSPDKIIRFVMPREDCCIRLQTNYAAATIHAAGILEALQRHATMVFMRRITLVTMIITLMITVSFNQAQLRMFKQLIPTV